jgi:hypothetical protein
VRRDPDLDGLGADPYGRDEGGWKLLFGELAELGEDMLALEAFACQRCRMVEFRVPSGSNV